MNVFFSINLKDSISAVSVPILVNIKSKQPKNSQQNNEDINGKKKTC